MIELELHKEEYTQAEIAVKLGISALIVREKLCALASATYQEKYRKWIKSKAKNKPKSIAHYYCYCAGNHNG